MSAPPVPPRPLDVSPHARQASLPPPVPPLPADLRRSVYEEALAAPTPHRASNPAVAANMSRIAAIPNTSQVPLQSQWSAWVPPVEQMAALSFAGTHHPSLPHHRSLVASTYGPPQKPPSPPAGDGSTLTAPIPTIPALQTAVQAVQQPMYDPISKVAWSRDVIFLVNRAQQSTSADAPSGPVAITDSRLLRLTHVAVPIILDIASKAQQQPIPPHVAEAIYLRATFAASGGFPDFLRQNLRAAFRDFETAARAGYALAWFRLGRDYESFNDFSRARDCFERGVKLSVESCCYRMGMAHLMGQLGLPVSLDHALPLLHRAATLATLDCPQPAYVYALLLLDEFTQVSIPPQALAPFIPARSSSQTEARKHLERAAFLHFSPAQYKLGHAHEFAEPPFPFDPLLSVQYYSLASQQGEVEADMALSKWFLCGSGDDSSSPGHFEKDENLAWTFADKAARRGLPSAEFAMGYYAEVGVGGPKDVNIAIKWYKRAKAHGNSDAAERLTALEQSEPQALSRKEHDVITEDKLVRKRTQAKQRSDAHGMHGGGPYSPPRSSSQPAPIQHPQEQQRQERNSQQQIMDLARRTSMLRPHHPGRAPSYPDAQQQQPQSHPSSAGSSPHLRPQRVSPHPQQQYPNLNRYTLTDNPVPLGGYGVNELSASRNASPGRPGSAGNPSGGRYGRGRAVSGGVGVTTPPQTISPGPIDAEVEGGSASAPTARPHKYPSTFAEMGIQGARAEEKECVVM